MAIHITNKCINCDECLPECPTEAISKGQEIFIINPALCTECVGFHQYLACQKACPVDCCVPDPGNVEDEATLIQRAREVCKDIHFRDDYPSRYSQGGNRLVPNAAKPVAFPAVDVPGTGQLHATLVTTLGEIKVRLEEDRVPNTVKNFVGLAKGTIDWKDPKTSAAMKGTPCYDGQRFHRVIRDFMFQCGDPLTRHSDMKARWGTGGAGYVFPDEIHTALRHNGAGILSMANQGPNTNSAQWFILDGPQPRLDGKNTVFGAVVSGMDVVRRIAQVRTDHRDMPIEDVVLQKVDFYRGS